MAVYRCNSCGATTDTDATARALRESLGYGPGTEIALTAPEKCDVCGSTDIAQVTEVPPAAEAVSAEPESCKSCGAELDPESQSLLCPECGKYHGGDGSLSMGLAVAGISGFLLWVCLTNALRGDYRFYVFAILPLIFFGISLSSLVEIVRDSTRAVRSARKARGQM